MEIILKGIITGTLLSILIGATFFVLIETSMTRGFKAALWFDAGVVLCDLSIITAVYFFTSWITKTIIQNQYFNIAGGIVFMTFGAIYIFARQRNETEPVTKSRNVRLFMNGFLINAMNPSVVLFWLGTMAVTLSRFKYTGKETFVYYTATLCTMALFDVIKAYFASRISSFINPKVLRTVYVFSGLVMIVLGAAFIFK